MVLDGRKNNKGTKGNNGGRPSKADEIALIESMDAILVPDTAWQALADLVKAKDHNAIKTWLSYRFGMPKQSINHSGSIISQELPLTPEQAKEALAKLNEL